MEEAVIVELVEEERSSRFPPDHKKREPLPFNPSDFTEPAPIYWDDAYAWGKRCVGDLPRDPRSILTLINEERVKFGLPEFAITDFVERFGVRQSEAA